MKSAIQIINQALIFLGEAPIESANIGTKAAIAAQTVYEPTVDEVLRAHPWNFAVKRQTLPPLADAPPFGYAYQFQRPADWLRTLSCSARDYRMEGGRIHANEESIDLRYIARITDVTLYDALFCTAVARCMSSKLAYPITKSTSKQQAEWELYVQVLGQAKFVDALEEPAEEFEESSLITVRRGW